MELRLNYFFQNELAKVKSYKVNAINQFENHHAEVPVDIIVVNDATIQNILKPACIHIYGLGSYIWFAFSILNNI